jgi:hypothetical protein
MYLEGNFEQLDMIRSTAQAARRVSLRGAVL